MSIQDKDLQLLTAYVLGELTGPESERIRRLVESDPTWRASYEEIKLTSQYLQTDLSTPPVGLTLAERAQVEEGWQKLEKLASRRRIYRRSFAFASAMAVAAVAFVIVLPHSKEAFLSKSKVEYSPASIPPERDSSKDLEYSSRKVIIADQADYADRAHGIAAGKLAQEAKPRANSEKLEFAGRASSPSPSKAMMKGNNVSGFKFSSGGAASSEVKTQGAGGSKMNFQKEIQREEAKAETADNVVLGGEGEVFKGIIDQEAVRTLLGGNRGVFQRCYDSVANQTTKPSGRVILNWNLNQMGQVENLKVLSTSLQAPLIEACLISEIKKMQFPMGLNKEATITYPFTFTSQK